MAARDDTLLTIDTHHHMLPDFFWQETENAHAPVGGLAPLRWSKDVSISFMDDASIDVAVVSLSTPGVHTGDSVKARTLARRCNEFAAELLRVRPDRFASLACLPLPDIDASLSELAYALDVLELDGVVLFTNAKAVYLGDGAFTIRVCRLSHQSHPGDFVPRTPLHARSRGPRRPAPLAWLTRFRSFALL